MIKISSIILNFREGVENVFYLCWCNGITFTQYQDTNKSISVSKGSILSCELTDYSNKSILKKKDRIYKEFECVSCKTMVHKEETHQVPYSFLIKYNNFIRTQSNFHNMPLNRHEMLNFIKPITIFDHNDDKNKILKIGVL